LAEIEIRRIGFFSKGDPIVGDLYVPAGPAPEKGFPTILCLHGYGGLRKTTVPETAKRYAQEGFVALSFDYRGFGESGGDRGRLDPRRQVEDTRNAITFATLQSEVDPRRIGIHGSSFGGGVGIAASAQDARVRATVCSVGVGNGHRWLKSIRRNYEWLEFVADIEKDRAEKVTTGVSRRVSPYYVMLSDPVSSERQKTLNAQMPERVFEMPLECAEAIIEWAPEDELARARPIPGLVIRVENDQLVPDAESEAIFAKWPGSDKAMKVVPGVKHHDLFTTALPEVLSATIPFFREKLAA
jgi:pimeloyl-ACP methyl ester carboxylesterase